VLDQLFCGFPRVIFVREIFNYRMISCQFQALMVTTRLTADEKRAFLSADDDHDLVYFNFIHLLTCPGREKSHDE
jgi:hypothetical protein